MKCITFVVPVYRNEGSLKPLHKSLVSEFINNFKGELEYEIIFVNDGSDDKSYAEILEIKAIDDNVKVISFSRNFGQMGAILAGWKYAKGDAAMNISADMQEPTGHYINMINEWKRGGEVVIGMRENREDSATAKLKSVVFYRLMRYAFPQMPKGGFDVTLLDRKPLDALNEFTERGRFYQGNILWLGFDVRYVPYTRLKRTIGKSQNSVRKMLAYSINAFLNATYLPIRLMTGIGMITALLGFIYAIVIIYAYLVNRVPFTGWAPIMVLILVIGGLIMLMLGIIGEYIWRILDETRNRPHYIIKDKHF